MPHTQELVELRNSQLTLVVEELGTAVSRAEGTQIKGVPCPRTLLGSSFKDDKQGPLLIELDRNSEATENPVMSPTPSVTREERSVERG